MSLSNGFQKIRPRTEKLKSRLWDKSAMKSAGHFEIFGDIPVFRRHDHYNISGNSYFKYFLSKNQRITIESRKAAGFIQFFSKSHDLLQKHFSLVIWTNNDSRNISLLQQLAIVLGLKPAWSNEFSLAVIIRQYLSNKERILVVVNNADEDTDIDILDMLRLRLVTICVKQSSIQSQDFENINLKGFALLPKHFACSDKQISILFNLEDGLDFIKDLFDRNIIYKCGKRIVLFGDLYDKNKEDCLLSSGLIDRAIVEKDNELIELFFDPIVLNGRLRDCEAFSEAINAINVTDLQLTCKILEYYLLLNNRSPISKELSSFLLSSIQNGRIWNKNALFISVAFKYHNVEHYLMENGANTNVVDKDGDTVFEKSVKFSPKLYQESPDWSPLMNACNLGDSESVKSILNSNSNEDVNLADRNHWTALMIACYRGYRDIVEKLMEHDVKVNLVNAEGWHSLMLASSQGDAKIVGMLLKRGADATICTQDRNMTSLMIACRKGHVNVVNVLLERGSSNINAVNSDGLSALIIAIQAGHSEVVSALLEKGATYKSPRLSWTPLMLASYLGHLEVVKTLLDIKQVEVNAKDESNWTALMLSVHQKHYAISDLLIEQGASVDGENDDHWSALTFAVHNGDIELVQRLLKLSAFISTLNLSFKVACNDGESEIVSILRKKISQKVFEEIGRDGVIMAAQNGHALVVGYLIDEGIDVNLRYSRANLTPLMMAAYNGHDSTVGVLIAKGSDVNATNRDGWTALMLASQNPRNVNIVKNLLKSGADPFSETYDDIQVITALYIAEQHNNFEIAHYLRQAQELYQQENCTTCDVM